MNPNELEHVYDAIALAIDEVPAPEESAFLARLTLVLAERCGDVTQVIEAIEIAKAGISR